MKSILKAYFQKNFPAFFITGYIGADGFSWRFNLQNENHNVVIHKFGCSGRYAVEIGDEFRYPRKFYYPKSMAETFQLLKDKLA